MNRYEAIFGLSLATALVLDACGPAQATATDKLSTGDGGGVATETVGINIIETETPTTTPEPTLTPTPEIPQPGEVWIEQMGEVEPLDLEMTTEFTIEWEKMPKITWEDVSSGRLRETILQKWKREGKLTAEYIVENKIYTAKPEDWVESPYHAYGVISGSYLNVYDAENPLFPPNFGYVERPIRPVPEVFELVDEVGEREAEVGTSMVMFERPDKTVGVEPWFYFLDSEIIGPKFNGRAAKCLGHESPSTEFIGLIYPVPVVTFELKAFTLFRRGVDWNKTGRYEAQGELLRKVISDGYPSPELGKELLTIACIGMDETK